MEVNVNSIYRLGDMLVRVADIKGDRVLLVTGAICDKSELLPALPVNTRVTTTDGEAIISEEITELTDETKVCGQPFIKNGIPSIGVLYYPSRENINNKLYKEVSDFFDDTSYRTTPFALTKILGKWESAKERLRKLLSVSPVWNEDSLALIWNIEVPDCQEKEAAREIFNAMMDQFRREYREDFDHCVRFGFDQFLEIEDNREFKAFGYKIAAGMRPARALRRYFETLGVTRIQNFEKLFAQLADQLSDRKLVRKIVLSIHPLDYLRMSYGVSWKSCHHVKEHGCFSGGTLSYMMDSTSMVCTLLEPGDSDIPTYQQPKINRMMFFLNEKGDILQSRLYPQTRIPELEEILAKEVTAKLKEVLKIEDAYKAVISDQECDRYVWSIGNHYHDYACYNFGQNIWSRHETPNRFVIGAPGVCVTCGDVSSQHGSLSCGCGFRFNSGVRQEVYYICPNSGEKFYNKELATLNPADGKYYLEKYICPECGCIHFDKNEVYCPDCRKDHEMTCCGCSSKDIYVVFHGKAYCEKCAALELAYCEVCGKLEYRKNLHEVDDQLVCDDCIGNMDGMFYCEDCGEWHDEEDSYYIEGFGRICRNCYEYGNYGYCDDCGRYFRDEDLNYINGRDVCDDCRDENYVCCEHCGEWICYEDAIRIDDDCYCPDCAEEHFTRCERCDEYVSDPIEVEGDYFCEDCAERVAYQCEKCGEWFYKNHCTEIDGKYYCEDCAEEIEEEKNAAAELQKGVLTKDIDSRFVEGLTVTILSESETEYRIGLEGRQLPYRYVPKSFITINDSESA
jgi:Prokaryotic dksA/traR C4-type zinc finger.